VDTSRPAVTKGLPDEALQEVNRLWTIARAFSNTAHDVNNALQVIAGSAELIEARDLDPALRRRVETIRMQAGRAAATIERLLLYSRAAPEGPRHADLAALLESAVAMRTFAMSRGGIAVLVERSDPQPYWVAVDCNRTLQALLDVLLAAEAFVRSRRDARIVARLDRQDQAVCVSVTAVAGGDGDLAQASPLASPSSAVAAVTTDAEVWTALSLVGGERGTFHLRETEAGVTMELSFPAVQPPA
jgi:signal transduction histidine kinase